MRGRKPNKQPALAYDYHRAVFLVQLIALGVNIEALQNLAQRWDVPFGGDHGELLQRLAEHALEHARNST